MSENPFTTILLELEIPQNIFKKINHLKTGYVITLNYSYPLFKEFGVKIPFILIATEEAFESEEKNKNKNFNYFKFWPKGINKSIPPMSGDMKKNKIEVYLPIWKQIILAMGELDFIFDEKTSCILIYNQKTLSNINKAIDKLPQTKKILKIKLIDLLHRIKRVKKTQEKKTQQNLTQEERLKEEEKKLYKVFKEYGIQLPF